MVNHSQNSVNASSSKNLINAQLGKYHLIAKLGSGGMANVFLASSQGPAGFNKLGVVKVLRDSLADDETMVNMFYDEACLSARLSHPNIVQTYDVGKHDKTYYLTMEYLDGLPFSKLIKKQSGDKKMPIEMWCSIMAGILHGLQYAHDLTDYDGTKLNIIHRDISPGNLFVCYNGQSKLVDFGIAKAKFNSTKTEIGILKGKSGYMSPEYLQNPDIDSRSDIFSMGVVFWEALSGKRLFEGDFIRTLRKIVDEPIPKLSTVMSDIPNGLDDIIAKALEKDPDKRYQTATEMAEAIEKFLQSSKLSCSQKDVADYMMETFAKRREETEKQINESMNAIKSQDNVVQFSHYATIGGNDSNPSLPVIGSSPGETISQQVMQGSQIHNPNAAVTGMGAPGTLTNMNVPSALYTQSGHMMPVQKSNKLGYVILASVFVVILMGGLLGYHFLVGAKSSGANTNSNEVVTVQETISTVEPIAKSVKPIRVHVTSEPAQSLVSWDGKKLGYTPTFIELPIGKHEIVVSKAGYKIERTQIDLRGDDRDELEQVVFLDKIVKVKVPSEPQQIAEKAPQSPVMTNWQKRRLAKRKDKKNVEDGTISAQSGQETVEAPKKKANKKTSFGIIDDSKKFGIID